MKSGIFWAVLLWGISLNAIAALHKWVDADGKIHYSDSAPPDVKTKKIKSSSTSQTTSEFDNDNDTSVKAVTPSTTKSIAERERDFKKSQQEREKSEQKISKEQELKADKLKNCEIAQSNLSTLQNSPRVVSYNAQGERIIMDDESRSTQTEEAQKAVSKFCN